MQRASPEDHATSVPPDSSVYYQSHYWNDLPRVLEYINENATGDRGLYWMADFKARFCRGGPFEHGLFVACGNGWAERDLIDRGIVRRATGFDYGADLLAAAEHDRGEREITYFRADINRVELEENAYDLVVNIGALHHVQYINRFARMLCRTLKPGGVLVAYDYIGPGRNQYSRRHWNLVSECNDALPPELRKDRMRRPHLPTMLAEDPTEAIHADLVLDALGRYFTVEERHDLGGGVAYEVLTHNPKFFGKVPDAVMTPHLERLLEKDRRLTADGAVPHLFSYYIARPDKQALVNPELDSFQHAEDAREQWAARHGGVYSWTQYGWLMCHRYWWKLARRAGHTPLGARLRRALRR
jgi:SAM-dependent methyltransferase